MPMIYSAAISNFPAGTGRRGRAVARPVLQSVLIFMVEIPGNPECPVWPEHSADPLCRTHLFEQSQFPGRADKLSRPAQQSGTKSAGSRGSARLGSNLI